MNTAKQIKIFSDADQIESLGGVSELANKLGYSVQRVYNWKVRGIPPYIKLEYPELFQNKPSTKPNSENAA